MSGGGTRVGSKSGAAVGQNDAQIVVGDLDAEKHWARLAVVAVEQDVGDGLVDGQHQVAGIVLAAAENKNGLLQELAHVVEVAHLGRVIAHGQGFHANEWTAAGTVSWISRNMS
jgi:hypothetical protein